MLASWSFEWREGGQKDGCNWSGGRLCALIQMISLLAFQFTDISECFLNLSNKNRASKHTQLKFKHNSEMSVNWNASKVTAWILLHLFDGSRHRSYRCLRNKRPSGAQSARIIRTSPINKKHIFGRHYLCNATCSMVVSTLFDVFLRVTGHVLHHGFLH